MNWLEQYMAEHTQRREIISWLRGQTKYNEWRKKVIRRDEYTCQKCGKKIFLGLHAHHEKSIYAILFENKITTYQDALNFKPLWDSDNGISLCKNCHSN